MRRRRFRLGRQLTLCVALLLGGLVPSVALADDYDDALRDGAAARDVARETHRAADWQRALSHFMRAVSIDDTMAARFELAEAAHGLGWIDVAYASYELALEKGLFGKAASVARDYLEAHRSDVARIVLSAPPGTLVFVDGRERATLPLDRPLVVPAGNVKLRLVAAEREPWEQAVNLDAQVVMRLEPEFEPPPRAAPPAPVVPPPPPPAPDSASFLARPSSVVLLSLGVVSLITGGILAYEWQDSEDEMEDTRSQITAALRQYSDAGYFGSSTVPCGPNGVANGVATFDTSFPINERARLVSQFSSACELFDQRRARADRFQTATYVAFGTTAAASLTLLGLYLFDDEAEPEVDRGDYGPRIVPVLGSDTQGLVLNMRF